MMIRSIFSQALSKSSNLTRTMSSPSGNELKVEHSLKDKKFFIKIGKDEAILEYDDMIPGVYDMYHTGVPTSLRGKGIAAILAQAAFDHVVSNNLKMKLTCSYLKKFYEENLNKSKYMKSII